MLAIQIGGGMILVASIVLAWSVRQAEKAMASRAALIDTRAALIQRRAALEALILRTQIDLNLDLRRAARAAGYDLHRRRER